MMLVCKLCEKRMDVITWTHLKKWHGITTAEYRVLFPDETMAYMSPEIRERLGKNRRGIKFSEEWKRNLSKAHMGQRLRLGSTHTEESKEKMRQSHLGKKVTFKNPELRGKRISAALKRSKYWVGRIITDETKRRVSKSMLGKKNCLGHIQSEETRKLKSEASKRNWQDPGYRDKVVKAAMKGNNISPNKPETALDVLLQETFPDVWRYVGDGSFILAGKCPDFVNVNGEKQIIELFGDYWHKDDDGQDRSDLFKEFGYDTLIIWEHELEDRDEVIQKISSFGRRI